MSTPVTTTVNILDKDYRISCPEPEQAALIEAARHLDHTMREIRNGGKVIGIERIAVLAALNITHEMLRSGMQTSTQNKQAQEQINSLLDRLDGALKDNHELDL
ncbi:cell division protein ZapA [Sansalvadorimonas sp. 2012CJ34-2]|uniref:Cell division protein ZapA n=1 Tax=Parendozoicomonas callyspongiae TaxID=2942213 RepID=A0ABT0PG13_9GAMM|nr:cell division protein ZapA [Sansalvadorimonas sp. 2012CJ34-2]MCL6270278.1 cell division protein ZapA [Sansalvadorimonas sp. 2012CJ34-2]